MEIKGRNILVLGGGGMVGVSVCRKLLPYKPARLVVAARRESKARRSVEQLNAEFPDTTTRLVPLWGDIFLRSEWQGEGGDARARVLSDQEDRRRLIADVFEPLDDDILQSSLLYQSISGTAPKPAGAPAEIVVDCMNTATAVSYQDIYTSARHLAGLAKANHEDTDWPDEVEAMLAALSVPQLVRHVQILYESMRRAGTKAYVKVGTSGTGGMGFNIPYTHGEEKPSRLLLSKAAMAGAQTALSFLMARTPDAPPMIREIKPAALIGWREIGYGTIARHGREIPLYDCPLEDAVSIEEASNLNPEGPFGRDTGENMKGVYIDTGENGLYSADEFKAITTLGQMQIVTTEDVAENVVRELVGGNTGRDVIAALDGSVTGSSYRGGFLREAALNRLHLLEGEHGQAVAFEILGPPRLSKLLYEAYLLKDVAGKVDAVIEASPDEMAKAVAERIGENAALRQRILSIGIPILLPDGERILRGPVVKSTDAHHGWVDLTPGNIQKWQERLSAIRRMVETDLAGDTSSRSPGISTAIRAWSPDQEFFDIGEIAGWIFLNEEAGGRMKD